MIVLKIPYLFGVIGTVAVLAWIASLALFAATCRSYRRSVFWLGALALAMVAMLLAKINSAAVSDIGIDESAKIEAQRQEMIRQRQEQLKKLAKEVSGDPTRIKFAEDDGHDALDLAGLQANEGYAPAAANPEPAATAGTGNESAPVDATAAGGEEEPAYRRRGTKQREAGKSVGLEEAKEVKEEEEKQANIRLLPEPDKLLAGQLDSFNLLCARFTLVLAFLLVLLDTLSRFNRTFSTGPTLPLSGPFVDLLSPKTHSAFVNVRNQAVMADHLRTALRKGETFIYFGAADPLTGDLPDRLPLLLPAPRKFVFSMDEPPPGPAFVYESAWFDRCCFVILGETLGNAMLADLAEWLERRCRTRARARQTVNLIWDYPAPPSVATLTEMLRLCPETNFRFMLFCDAPQTEEFIDNFEEAFVV